MPDDVTDPNPKLPWAGAIWSRLTRLQCAGVLHIALRYGERTDATNGLIESISNLAWADLGRPLQLDVTRALLALEKTLVR